MIMAKNMYLLLYSLYVYVFIIMMEGSLLCLVFYYIVNRIIIVILGFAGI